MDYQLIKKLVWGKLRDRGTYIVALVVGSLINLYGQWLVPWLRGIDSPLDRFLDVLGQHPGTTLFSIFLGFAFPFCVGTYSSVATRYKNRRIESVADFPDRKPDPVFRVNQDGTLVEQGELTRELFTRYNVNNARDILGEEVWSSIAHDRGLDPGTTILFEPEGARYAVAYVLTGNRQINIYLTRLGL